MAITLVGVASTPADNGSATGPTVAIDKDSGALASAQAGDLIAVWVQYRGAISSDTAIKVNERSGQYWEHLPQGTSGSETRVPTGRWIICRRFSGTWGAADPSFSHYSLETPTGTAGLTAVAFVFRPSSASKHWIVERNNRGTFTAGTSPFTKTITGVTPTNNSNVTVACWASSDDNTWGNLSGANWTQTGLSAQYRNLAGSDMSCAFAYQIQTTAAATGNVSLDQTALGGDAGITSLITFAEIDLPTGGTPGTGAYVDSGMGEGESSTTTLTATLRSGPSTPGNTLVALFHFESAAQGWVSSITDDGGNTYYQLMIQCDTGMDQIAMWYFAPNASAASTCTVTLSQAETFWALYLYEFNGALAFDGASGIQWRGDDDFTGLNIACPSYTPSVNGCTLVGMAFRTGGGDHNDLIDADGWTLGERAATEADVTHYQVQTTVTAEDYDIDSVAPSAGTGGNAGNTIAGFIVLRPAAGGAAVTPGVAALVLAGSQAGLLRELLIRPGVGLLALSAHQAHVLRERLLAPGVAAPTFFGQQPAISMPAQAAVFAGTGALVILGLQPTLLYARAVQPATGVLTLTGLQPTLARERIVIAGIGELALVPRDVAEFLGRLVQPGSSALTFGGEQPALQLTEGLRLDPDAGAAALQGRAPTLLRELVVTPGVGAVVVVPLAPSLDLPFAWYDTSASASLVWSAALAGSATWTAARSAPPVAWS